MYRRVLRTPDAARYVGFTPSTLEKMRLSGNGPSFVRIGLRAVGYTIDDLDSFIEFRRRRSTSDPGLLDIAHSLSPRGSTCDQGTAYKGLGPAELEAPRERVRSRKHRIVTTETAAVGEATRDGFKKNELK